MTKKNSLPFLFLFIAILFLLSIPKTASEYIRGNAIAIFSPLWNYLSQLKLHKNHLINEYENLTSQHSFTILEEIEYLQLQNQLQAVEISKLHHLYEHEHHLNTQFSRLNQLSSSQQENLRKVLKTEIDSIPASVIFRSPALWNSSLWINVGEEDNMTLAQPIIFKNSPVIVGNSIIGVLDFVGKHQSRVRLITDSGLNPSVRALRGSEQNHELIDNIQYILTHLQSRKDLLTSKKEKEFLIKMLEKFKLELNTNDPSSYLAKGELRGTGKPLWRSEGSILHGTGFNYDFADELGPARDLQTGKPLGVKSKVPSTPLLKVRDLLVTTGMDGVFPPGLRVAEVTKIHPLKEGDYYYELEATPTAGDLNNLSLVFVIAPLGYNPENLEL